MARRLARFLIAVPALLALLAFTATACGPYFAEAIFVRSDLPDMPLDSYAAGNLGIVQPTYSYSYLVAAYRYFSGRGFSDVEQKRLLAYWNQRLSFDDAFQYGQTQGTTDHRAQDARDLWDAVRAELSSANGPERAVAPRLPASLYATGSNYADYLNCLPDAYLTAVKTLGQRAQQFGPSSTAVNSWVNAQDAVFRNCDGSSTANPIAPAPAETDLPPVLRKDREYQTAAAYFYAGDLDEAKRRFLAIAADPSSPWRATAALVAARCDIRSFLNGDGGQAMERLSDADTQLEKIIADPSLASMKVPAQQLRGFTQFRIAPERRVTELGNILERDTSPETFETDFGDYTLLLKAGINSPVRSSQTRNAAMTEWIYAFKNAGGPDDESFRVSRWQETKSVPWLVAALTYAHADTTQVVPLLEEAARTPVQSPAYQTLAFHRARILTEQGKGNQARGELDNILKAPANQTPASARNLFLALRMKLAQNLDEFARFASRHPSAVYFNFQGKVTGPEFDADAATILNQHMPTRLLAIAATNAAFPASLRREIVQSAWLRAVQLKQNPLAQQLVPALSVAAPDLSAALKTFSDAPDQPAREFAAAFLILQEPEMHPYVDAGAPRLDQPGSLNNYRQNWWCSQASVDTQGDPSAKLASTLGPPLRMIYPDGKLTDPLFITPAESQAAGAEWSALSALPAAPDWLAQQVLGWAKSHPNDPRVPEALHRVVVSTHLGCKDADTGNYSKQAFTLLHDKYPQSSWAAQTPYWYK